MTPVDLFWVKTTIHGKKVTYHSEGEKTTLDVKLTEIPRYEFTLYPILTIISLVTLVLANIIIFRFKKINLKIKDKDFTDTVAPFYLCVGALLSTFALLDVTLSYISYFRGSALFIWGNTLLVVLYTVLVCGMMVYNFLRPIKDCDIEIRAKKVSVAIYVLFGLQGTLLITFYWSLIEKMIDQ